MIRKDLLAAACAAALVPFCFAPAAWGQEAQPPAAGQPADQAAAVQGEEEVETEEVFEEITVTAKKREESIYEVPVAITAFTGEELQRQNITDLIDIGKFVPNLNVTGFSAGHTSSANPFIRGIGLQDHLITTDPGVSVYVDGSGARSDRTGTWRTSSASKCCAGRRALSTAATRSAVRSTSSPGRREAKRPAGSPWKPARADAGEATSTPTSA